jgi:precorrin isomerase
VAFWAGGEEQKQAIFILGNAPTKNSKAVRFFVRQGIPVVLKYISK